MVIDVENYFCSGYPFLLFDGNKIGLRVKPWWDRYRSRTISRLKSCKRCICQVAVTKEIKGVQSIQLGDNPLYAQISSPFWYYSLFNKSPTVTARCSAKSQPHKNNYFTSLLNFYVMDPYCQHLSSTI